MDPTSKEYAYTAELLRKELGSFKHEQKELRQKTLSLYQKNKLLLNELRENILIRDHELSDKGIHNLEHKLSLAIAAKECAILLWQEAMHQLERQEDQLVGRKSLVETERKEVVSGIGQIKEQYLKGVVTLSAELSEYRTNLSHIKQELQNKFIELEQKKIELKNVKEELVFSETQLSALSAEKTELSEKCNSFQQALNHKTELLSATKKDLDQVNTKYTELLSHSADLEEENKKLKHTISVLEKDAKESLFAAQEAILQKKEMAYREEQYTKEIDILKSAGGIDVQKVELRCKLKLQEIKEQNLKQVNSLILDNEELLKEKSLKQSMLEKVEREKKALESKLELLCSSTSLPAISTMWDDLCNRLVLTEKERDEYELRIRSLQSDLTEIKSSKEQETKRYAEEKNVLKDRLDIVSKEFRQFLSDKIKLSEELCKLKKKYQELEKQLTFKKARERQEMSAFRNEADLKQQSYDEMLQAIEEHYKTICCELQALLESQFKINKKWKEETDELISQSESKIIELCDTIAQLQYQNTELVAALQENSSYRQIISNHSFFKQ